MMHSQQDTSLLVYNVIMFRLKYILYVQEQCFHLQCVNVYSRHFTLSYCLLTINYKVEY